MSPDVAAKYSAFKPYYMISERLIGYSGGVTAHFF